MYLHPFAAIGIKALGQETKLYLHQGKSMEEIIGLEGKTPFISWKGSSYKDGDPGHPYLYYELL